MKTLLLATALLGSAVSAQPADSIRAVLADALYDAALGETLDLMEFSRFDPSDPGTAGFARMSMEPRVLALYEESGSTEEVLAFAAWTRRGDVAPFLARERQTGSPEYQDTVDRYLERTTPSTARIEAVERVLDLMDYPALGAAYSARYFALLGLAMEVNEAERSVLDRYEDLITEMDQTRGDFFLDAAAGQLLGTYLTAYASASPRELAQFEKALRLPAAQWYFRTMPQVMLAAYDEAAVAYGESLQN
ncbi:MAG: hypothetical protein AAGI52_00120 [Bacteroidota bacterium]